MGISAGLIGVGGALSGLFGGGGGIGGGGSVPQFNTPYNATIPPAIIGSQTAGVGANTASMQGLDLNVWGNQGFPTLNQAFEQSRNTFMGPQALQYQFQSAPTAMSMGQNAATTAYNYGQGIFPYAQSLFPYAQSIESMALDPQSALYNRTLAQLQDQINVANTQSGVGTSPYGASVAANALGNFNINWQNNQLQRAIQGGQAASGIMGGGANTIGTAAQIAGTAPQSYLQASGWPFQVQSSVDQALMGLPANYASAMSAAQGPYEQSIADTFNLIGAENQTNQQAVQAYQAQIQAYNANLAAQQQQFSQNQAYGKALGASLGALGGIGSTGSGGNAWSGLNFSNSPLWGALADNNNYFGSQDIYSAGGYG